MPNLVVSNLSAEFRGLYGSILNDTKAMIMIQEGREGIPGGKGVRRTKWIKFGKAAILDVIFQEQRFLNIYATRDLPLFAHALRSNLPNPAFPSPSLINPCLYVSEDCASYA